MNAYYDPADPDLAPVRGETPSLWRHCSAAVPAGLIARLRPRKQQIGPLETLGALVCYLSRPEQFRNRRVIHFMFTGTESDVDPGHPNAMRIPKSCGTARAISLLSPQRAI